MNEWMNGWMVQVFQPSSLIDVLFFWSETTNKQTSKKYIKASLNLELNIKHGCKNFGAFHIYVIIGNNNNNNNINKSFQLKNRPNSFCCCCHCRCCRFIIIIKQYSSTNIRFCYYYYKFIVLVGMPLANWKNKYYNDEIETNIEKSHWKEYYTNRHTHTHTNTQKPKLKTYTNNKLERKKNSSPIYTYTHWFFFAFFL